jgi:hypothetical protein
MSMVVTATTRSMVGRATTISAATTATIRCLARTGPTQCMATMATIRCKVVSATITWRVTRAPIPTSLPENDGHDVIYNYDSDSAVDKVQFSDVTLCDITGANRTNTNDFVLSYGTVSQVTVKYHFSAVSYQIGQFVFSDGATIDTVIMGTAAGEVLNGSAISNDFIIGAGGADSMTGLAGDDVYLTDGGDSITEVAGGGTDTVLSSVTYTLSHPPRKPRPAGRSGRWNGQRRKQFALRQRCKQ